MPRVLGIDPGTVALGWGAIDAVGNRFVHVESGVIRVQHDRMVDRLCALADELDSVLLRLQPAAVAIETMFFAKNSQSAIKLGQARGVALLCAARSGALVSEYTPGQIKQSVTGRGRAEKSQVQQMVNLLLGLGSQPRAFDETDALAAAVCHAQMAGSFAALLQKSPAKRKMRALR